MAEDQNEVLANAVAITGLDEDAVIALLEATDWNLEQAVNLHFAGGVQQTRQPGQSDAVVGSAHYPMEEDEVRAPLPTKVDRLYGDAGAGGPGRSGMGYQGALGAQGSSSRPQKPVEVFRDLKSEAADKDGKGGSALADMFKPPQELLYKGNLSSAKDVAQQEGRWMMINVQSSSEFASHQLNRDTFTHEAVQSAISGMFLFIQLQSDTPEGQGAQAAYRIQQLPCIMILDPITGATLYSRSGFIPAEKLLEDLVPFMDHKPEDPGGAQLAQRMTLKRKQVALSPGGGGSSGSLAAAAAAGGRQAPLTEDEQLARAIAASMDPGGGYSSGGGAGSDDGDDDDDEELQSMIAAVEAATAAAAAQPATAAAALGAAAAPPEAAPAQPALPPPEQVQAEAQGRLPAEPAEGAAGGCRVAVRLPTGDRFQRRFLETDTVQALHDLVLSNSTDAAGGKRYILGLAAPGGVTLDDPQQSLKDAGVANAMLAVKWAD